MVLNSPRLRLEPVTEAHLDHFLALNSDPEVMRFLLGRAATREETLDEWARRMGAQTDETRGLGYWAGFTNDDTFAGWWSASAFSTDETLAGLGYRLVRRAWGLGLATEGGRLMIAQGAAAPGVERVVASTMAVNTASRRVLEKLGMRHVNTYVREWDEPITGSEEGDVVYELVPGHRLRATPGCSRR
ncbi:MAG TPA: GNAT family N-acetyltransferase [Nocardioidaceae bacterium]|nr:GNAT family N-acetyltransferase [Nocardioidaceae bacterium]